MYKIGIGSGAVRASSVVRGVRGLLFGAAIAGMSVLGAGTAWASGKPHGATASAAAHRGGTLTVLENSDVAWASGLNPFTNTNGGVDYSLNNAIFGELFELTSGGKVRGDLATGYRISNRGKTLTIELRHNVKFSDGTPFDAAAVAYNFRKDFTTSCSCKPTWSATSIETPTPYTVVVHLKVADGAIINQFQDSIVNWMVSPTAVRKMSATAFADAPVGAGPFVVVSDTENSKLVLRRNSHYWQKGHPYLNGLVFETTSDDEAALEDLRAGDGQAYEAMSTPSLVSAFKAAGLTVTPDPATATSDVQLNTMSPPFNNIKAREAVYYATDAAALDKGINMDTFPVSQSFTGPTGLFYEPKVPGYRTYDLAKAKRLVHELGGLTFTLMTNSGPQQPEIAKALQSMYDAAGMHVTLQLVDLASLVQNYLGHKWNAAVSTAGSFDPAASTGLAFRYLGGAPFSGVNDPHLSALINAAASIRNLNGRARIYASIAAYLNKMAYSPFLYSVAVWNIAAKGVYGPGLTTQLPEVIRSPQILWPDVWMSGKA